MAGLDIERLDRRWKWWLLVVSATTLALLVASALKENRFADWQQYRRQYRTILEEKAKDDHTRRIADQFAVEIVQQVIPELNALDRCTTCHAGLDDPRMADQENPFKTHPGDFLSNHPPERFGCTVCHQGQGRATEKDDAHGKDPHWPYPMFAKQFMYSACGKCHDDQALFEEGLLSASSEDHNASEGAGVVREGKSLLESRGCLGCHVLNGRGGTLGPDITHVGNKTHHEFDFTHFAKDEPREVEYWLKKHFLEPSEVSPGTVMPDMGLSEEQAGALTAYVLSLRRSDVPAAYRPVPAVDRPTPAAPTGDQLYKRYCSACHGQYGEASEVPGIRTPALNNRDSLAVAGDDYYRFIIANGRTGTSMPAWGPGGGNLSRTEIDQIVARVRMWEATPPAVADVNVRDGDFLMGRAYYQGLCANCHGRQGEGGIGNALNSPTFLAIASDTFLAETIINGRPGTAMASWKHLPRQAVSDLLAYIRTWQAPPPAFEEVQAYRWRTTTAENVRVGEILYAGNCAGCHGRSGEGGIGLRLNSRDILPAVDDLYLYETIANGRPTTAMPAWRHLAAGQVAALIAYFRTWQDNTRLVLGDPPGGGDYALGEVHYRVSCLPCHGENGRGGVGPQLANGSFLRTVSNATLFQWIAHGRAETAMKGFLAAEQGPTRLTRDQIGDVIAYLRHLSTDSDTLMLRTGVGDPHVGRELFQGSCAGCHGTQGEGASGPQLNNPVFLSTASDGFLAATIAVGRVGTAMQSMVHGQAGIGQVAPENVQDIIAYMRLWDVPETWRQPRAVAEMSERAVTTGGQFFAQYCAGCHGPNGLGVQDGPSFFAPALNNPEFLNAATDGFLLATIARGRSNTPMRPFGVGTGGIAALDFGDISDIVSFIRTWQERQTQKGEPSS